MIEPALPQHWLILDWLLRDARKLDFRFVRYPWWKEVPPNYPESIIYADIHHKGVRCFGLGHNKNERVAHAIAAAEAMERAMMIEFKLNSSNGCAVHTDPEKTRENALQELIERDAFLCHFSTGTPLIEVPELYETARWKELAAWSQKMGFRIRFGGMKSLINRPTGLVILDQFRSDNPNAFFLGLGVAPTWEGAFERALPEALRFLNSWHTNPENFTPLTIEEFISIKHKGITEHVRLAMNPDYCAEFSDRLFPMTKEQNFFDKSADEILPATQYQEGFLGDIWEGCPLYFARATNPHIANIGFGDAWADSHHPERFKQFSPRMRKLIPHCLG